MQELPVCRWRKEPTEPGRYACVSRKIHAPPRGVTEEQCLTCWCRDHAERPALPGPCVHLGARVGLVLCEPCGAAAGRPVQVPAHACALHGRCTIAANVPGLYCCECCPDRASEVRAPAAGLVRHLTYFVCPLGQMWRWNVQQLRRRMDLFNGRRVVFVVQGPGLAPVELVKQELDSARVEWITADNNPVLKEYVGFPALLRALSSCRSEEDVTFYGHCKGVSSSAWGPGVQAWAESMYEGLLDYWPVVRGVLEGKCCAGVWRKRQGWYPVSPSTWHYAGTFRWVRNRDMYSRRWDEYMVDWCCPEDHVGRVFRWEESGCLFGDIGHPGTHLYGLDAWNVWARGEWERFKSEHVADRFCPPGPTGRSEA